MEKSPRKVRRIVIGIMGVAALLLVAANLLSWGVPFGADSRVRLASLGQDTVCEEPPVDPPCEIVDLEVGESVAFTTWQNPLSPRWTIGTTPIVIDGTDPVATLSRSVQPPFPLAAVAASFEAVSPGIAVVTAVRGDCTEQEWEEGCPSQRVVTVVLRVAEP